LLTITCWRWGRLFSAAYVNRLRAAFERHLRLPHEVVCVTDDPAGIDSRVRIVPIPTTYAHTPRCRRRMQVYSRDFASQLGDRLLLVDLDLVVVGDLTPLLDRPEPLVCWKVGYANVYAGAWVLMDAGVLDPMWRAFAADPEGHPRRAGSREAVPSDLAMLNAHLRGRAVPHWTERDGLVSYFGAGYQRWERYGVGPSRPQLPRGARVVVLGSADKDVMDEGRYPWVREHWSALPGEAA
jgi:hypothetical protein